MAENTPDPLPTSEFPAEDRSNPPTPDARLEAVPEATAEAVDDSGPDDAGTDIPAR